MWCLGGESGERDSWGKSQEEGELSWGRDRSDSWLHHVIPAVTWGSNHLEFHLPLLYSDNMALYPSDIGLSRGWSQTRPLQRSPRVIVIVLVLCGSLEVNLHCEESNLNSVVAAVQQGDCKFELCSETPSLSGMATLLRRREGMRNTEEVDYFSTSLLSSSEC